MPSIATYTPLESLLFFQSVASWGATTSTLARISELLTQNDFIRQDESYNRARLAPKALQEFYNDLLKEEASRQNGVNGFVEGQANPRKRKLSSPLRLSPSQAAKDPHFWSNLINRLYAQYRDHAVGVIQSEEKKYDSLKGRLREVDVASNEGHDRAITDSTTIQIPDELPAIAVLDSGQTNAGESDKKDGSSKPQAQRQEGAQNVLAPPTVVQSAHSVDRKTSEVIQQSQNGKPTRTLQAPHQPTPSSQIASADYSDLRPHQTRSTEGQSLSPGISQPAGMPPPSASPLRPTLNSPASGMQPGPSHSPNTPVYPAYPTPQGQPPQWPQGLQQHQQQFLQAPSHAQIPPMHQDFSGRTPIMARSPQVPYQQSQIPSHPYPPALFNGTPSSVHAQGMMGQGVPSPWPGQSLSIASTAGASRNTPVASRLSMSLTGRSPWKSTPSTTTSEVARPPSREISPIPERIPSSANKPGTASKGLREARKDQGLMRKPDRPTRRTRAGSASPSVAADRSRSESIMSHTSDARNEPHRMRRQIKNETPSTPNPFIPSDSIETDSLRSSTRRRRGNTVQSQSQPRIPIKRKRGESADADETSETPRPVMPASTRPIVDQDKVYATRNFARICGPIMNDVTAHKHAGLFAKPLTERDAPGYRSLIYRPSDLKTIKSMIHAGTRAVNAALEDAASVSTPADGGTASPAVNTPTSGSAKNAAILLDKTADLVPPKAIVNSAQLEKELMRMFANAVMFNPMPKTERGFGPDVHLTKEGIGGDDTGEDQNAGSAGVEFKGYSNEEDSGNIIRDTREMMTTVEEAVRVWRDAEQGSITFGEEFAAFMPRAESTSGLRGGSVSFSETVGDDSIMDNDEAEGETGTGTARKRRRMAEA